jgi:hypothetical protein
LPACSEQQRRFFDQYGTIGAATAFLSHFSPIFGNGANGAPEKWIMNSIGGVS